MPILSYRSEIESEGIKLSISMTKANLDLSSDVLIIEDNVYTSNFDNEEIIPKVKELKNKVDKILWFDTDDSTGTITQGIIPIVDGYYKKQLLKDRKRYCKPLWRARYYTDYYYDKYDLDTEEVTKTTQINSESDLEKLGIFWNLAYEVYTPFTVGTDLLFKSAPISVTKRIPWNRVRTAPGVWVSPEKHRDITISGRFSTSHGDRGIRFHRTLFENKLEHKFPNEHINNIKYWQELRNSRILLSPYGWGEICHRDFEGFISGCLIIKPSMAHMETWPPLFEDGETMLSVEWDMSNLQEVVNWALKNDKESQEIAKKGQKRYRHYISSKSARNEFVDRFIHIVRK